MPTAKFVSRSGREVSIKIIRSRDQVWAERDGLWLEYADPIDDPQYGPLSFVEADDASLWPEDRYARKVRNFRQLGL